MSTEVCIQLKKAPAITEPLKIKLATSGYLLITLGPRLFVLDSLMVPPPAGRWHL